MPVLPCDARTARVADYECPRGRPSTAITEDQGAIGGPELYRPQSEGLAVGHNPGILIDRMVTQDGLIDVPGYRVIPVRIDEHHPAHRPVEIRFTDQAVVARTDRYGPSSSYGPLAGEVNGMKERVDLHLQTMVRDDAAERWNAERQHQGDQRHRHQQFIQAKAPNDVRPWLPGNPGPY